MRNVLRDEATSTLVRRGFTMYVVPSLPRAVPEDTTRTHCYLTDHCQQFWQCPRKPEGILAVKSTPPCESLTTK